MWCIHAVEGADPFCLEAEAAIRANAVAIALTFGCSVAIRSVFLFE
jgi:hypothetical protein